MSPIKINFKIFCGNYCKICIPALLSAPSFVNSALKNSKDYEIKIIQTRHVILFHATLVITLMHAVLK